MGKSVTRRVTDKLLGVDGLKDSYTPSELKKLGSRVHYFTNDSISGIRAALATGDFIKDHGGTLYTGIHRENDWSKTAWWEKGNHLANRTGDYAVVTEA